jgi:hypothetical protein
MRASIDERKSTGKNRSILLWREPFLALFSQKEAGERRKF